MFTAKNQAYGEILNYYLKEAVPAELPKKAKDDKEKKEAADNKGKADAAKKEGEVKISVMDKDGKLVREFDGPGAAGANRTNWDLRWNPPAEPTPEQQEAIAAGYGFGPRGPRSSRPTTLATPRNLRRCGRPRRSTPIRPPAKRSSAATQSKTPSPTPSPTRKMSS